MRLFLESSASSFFVFIVKKKRKKKDNIYLGNVLVVVFVYYIKTSIINKIIHLTGEI